MPKPLPENQYPPDSLHFHAYERCLELERSAEGPANKSALSSQTCGRILGHMMREAPTSVGCDNVQKEIESCATNDDLRALAQVYATNFFRICNITALRPRFPADGTFADRKARGRTLKSSSHPSRPPFDDTQQVIMFLMKEASTSNGAVKQLVNHPLENQAGLLTHVPPLGTKT